MSEIVKFQTQDFVFKYMRRLKDSLIFPIVDDISAVQRSDIVEKLNQSFISYYYFNDIKLNFL